MAHYFPYDVKIRLLAHSQRFLANQKARNAIVGAENLLISVSRSLASHLLLRFPFLVFSLHVTFTNWRERMAGLICVRINPHRNH